MVKTCECGLSTLEETKTCLRFFCEAGVIKKMSKQLDKIKLDNAEYGNNDDKYFIDDGTFLASPPPPPALPPNHKKEQEKRGGGGEIE